jgi:hypothetical protein
MAVKFYSKDDPQEWPAPKLFNRLKIEFEVKITKEQGIREHAPWLATLWG